MTAPMMSGRLWPIARSRQIDEQVGQGCIAPMRLDEPRHVVAARPAAWLAYDDELLLAGICGFSERFRAVRHRSPRSKDVEKGAAYQP